MVPDINSLVQQGLLIITQMTVKQVTIVYSDLTHLHQQTQSQGVSVQKDSSALEEHQLQRTAHLADILMPLNSVL